jgi:hypothetical protein
VTKLSQKHIVSFQAGGYTPYMVIGTLTFQTMPFGQISPSLAISSRVAGVHGLSNSIWEFPVYLPGEIVVEGNPHHHPFLQLDHAQFGEIVARSLMRTR